jgi:hypothetical protein
MTVDLDRAHLRSAGLRIVATTDTALALVLHAHGQPDRTIDLPAGASDRTL